MESTEQRLADALARCIAALKSVQPQIRGAIPAQDVRLAIEWGEEALEACAPNPCANCGNEAGVGRVHCSNCEAERVQAEAGEP